MKSYPTLLIAVMLLCPTLDTAFGESCAARCVSTEQCLKFGPDCRCIAFQCRTIGDRAAGVLSCGGRCVSSQQCQDFCDCPDCWCIDFQCKSIRGGNPAFSSAQPFENFMKSRPKMFPATKHGMRKFSFVN